MHFNFALDLTLILFNWICWNALSQILERYDFNAQSQCLARLRSDNSHSSHSSRDSSLADNHLRQHPLASLALEGGLEGLPSRHRRLAPSNQHRDLVLSKHQRLVRRPRGSVRRPRLPPDSARRLANNRNNSNSNKQALGSRLARRRLVAPSTSLLPRLVRSDPPQLRPSLAQRNSNNSNRQHLASNLLKPLRRLGLLDLPVGRPKQATWLTTGQAILPGRQLQTRRTPLLDLVRF